MECFVELDFVDSWLNFCLEWNINMKYKNEYKIADEKSTGSGSSSVYTIVFSKGKSDEMFCFSSNYIKL